jgi:hypothetical protein
MRRLQVLACVVAVVGSAARAHGQGIDAATVAAYEKLGAKYGGWINREGFLEFEAGRQNAERGLPGFNFHDAPIPTKLPQVAVPFGLDLGHTEWTNADLQVLVPLKSLTALSLRSTKVTSAGLKALAPLDNLVALDLSWNQEVNDQALKQLAPLKKLKALNLFYTPISNAGLKELAPLPGLEALRIGCTQVTDAGLKELAPLRNLNALCLTGTEVTDAGLKELAPLQNLATLYLRGDWVTNAGLKEIAALKNLMWLDLWHTGVTDAGLKELAGLKRLVALELGATLVTDAGLKELLPLGNLTTLGLSDTRILGHGIKDLAPLKKLAALAVPVTDASLRSLREIGLLHALPEAWGKDDTRPKAQDEVVALELGRTEVTDAGLKELVPLHNLTTLELHHAGVTGPGLKHLAPLKKLTTIHITLSDAVLQALREINALHWLGQAMAKNGGRPRSQDDVDALDTGATFGGSRVERLRGSIAGTDGMPIVAPPREAEETALTAVAVQPQVIPSDVTDAGLKELTVLKNLTALSLWRTPVTGAGLKDLAPLKKLVLLDLANTEVTDAGLKELAPFTKLEHLVLDFTEVSDEGVKHLVPLKNLSTLQLDHTNVTDAGLKALAPLTNLTGLSLMRTKATGAGFKAWPTVKNLAWVEISMTDSSLRTLRELGLLHKLRDARGKDGSRPKSLDDVVELNIGSAEVTEAGIKELAVFRNLARINLAWQHGVTPATLKALAALKSLTTLDLSGARFAAGGVEELASLTNLRTLYLWQADVTPVEQDAIRKALPKCVVHGPR